jgi:multiple sugar transport system substrate-binding protein
MGFTTSGLFSALEDPSASQVAGKLGYAPIPYADKAAGLIQSWSWAIPADSKNQQEAFKLGAWLTSKEQQKAMATVDPGFISFRQSLADDKALVANAPWLPAIKEALSNGVTLPLQPAATEFMTALDAGLSGVVTNGDDPKTMLQTVQASEGSKF